MTVPNQSLAHVFNISDIQTVIDATGVQGGSRLTQYRNQFDEFGDIVSLRRLPGEENWSYRRRIQDAMVHIANSSYRGMVYGITRELGLSLYDSIIVNPRVNGAGAFLASDPYIAFDGAYLYLYSDYANGVLEWAIDRYQPGGNYEHVGRLVDQINRTSFFFQAELHEGQSYYDRSMTILNQSNRGLVKFERVSLSTKFRLRHDKLVKGTVFFSDRDLFKTEVLSEDLVDDHGKFYIDYLGGIVTVFTIPSSSVIVRYQYTQYPFVTTASPVILHDITSDNFKVKMFQQVLLDDGTYTNGTPTELGVDIINELLSVVPYYWGI